MRGAGRIAGCQLKAAAGGMLPMTTRMPFASAISAMDSMLFWKSRGRTGPLLPATSFVPARIWTTAGRNATTSARKRNSICAEVCAPIPRFTMGPEKNPGSAMNQFSVIESPMKTTLAAPGAIAVLAARYRHRPGQSLAARSRLLLSISAKPAVFASRLKSAAPGMRGSMNRSLSTARSPSGITYAGGQGSSSMPTAAAGVAGVAPQSAPACHASTATSSFSRMDMDSSPQFLRHQQAARDCAARAQHRRNDILIEAAARLQRRQIVLQAGVGSRTYQRQHGHVPHHATAKNDALCRQHQRNRCGELPEVTGDHRPTLVPCRQRRQVAAPAGNHRGTTGKPLQTLTVKRANACKTPVARVAPYGQVSHFSMHESARDCVRRRHRASDSGSHGDIGQRTQSTPGPEPPLPQRGCADVGIQGNRHAEAVRQGVDYCRTGPATLGRFENTAEIRRAATQTKRTETADAQRSERAVALLSLTKEGEAARQRLCRVGRRNTGGVQNFRRGVSHCADEPGAPTLHCAVQGGHRADRRFATHPESPFQN